MSIYTIMVIMWYTIIGVKILGYTYNYKCL